MSLQRSRALVLTLLILGSWAPAQAASLKTQNIFLIVSDGLRWQEVFTGAEEALLNKENGGVSDVQATRDKFWWPTPEARRQALLPFLWSEVAREGQLFGNQNKGSVDTVTNGKNFSFPGYNEILTGAPDPKLYSNEKKPNRNVTVFEWLNGRPGFSRRIGVVGSWDAFPYIFNVARSHLPIWPTWEPDQRKYAIAAPRCLAELFQDTTPQWGDVTYDSFMFQAASDYVKRSRPRVLFVGFGETDDWAHDGRYDQYLLAAHHVDDFIRRLWEQVQSMHQYRGKTTFIITADHGRGSGPDNWKRHGGGIAGAQDDWLAVIGPDTSPLGERSNCAPINHSQIAATLATLLGEDYRATYSAAGPPVADLVRGGKSL